MFLGKSTKKTWTICRLYQSQALENHSAYKYNIVHANAWTLVTYSRWMNFSRIRDWRIRAKALCLLLCIARHSARYNAVSHHCECKGTTFLSYMQEKNDKNNKVCRLLGGVTTKKSTARRRNENPSVRRRNCQEESCGEGMIPDMVNQAKTEGVSV